jgi:hypothetical protein
VSASRPQASAAPCSSCGLTARKHVQVRHRKTGEPATLLLCDRCIEGEARTWRLRFEPVTDQAIEVKR